MGEKQRNKKILIAILFLYAFGLLSIGIKKDFRLVHEENAAALTSFALSHILIGPLETHFHNVFYQPRVKEKEYYPNHPPAAGLFLAGSFLLFQSDDPWVARLTAITFFLGSMALMLWLLSRFFSFPYVLLGGFVMATVPMGSFFGRMMNFEAPGFFFVLLQLVGYTIYKNGLAPLLNSSSPRKRGSRFGFGILCFGFIIGALVDWLPPFFSLAIFITEVLYCFKEKKGWKNVFILMGIGLFLLFFNIIHALAASEVWWYTWDKIFHHVTWEQEAKELSLFKAFFSQLEYNRRCFSHVGLASCLVVLGSMLLKKNSIQPTFLKTLMLISFGGTMAYLFLMMSWAENHHYLQFYLFPFVIFSVVLCVQQVIKWKETKPVLTKVLLAVIFLDVIGTSAYGLYRRHTREASYAIKKTKDLREAFIMPGTVLNR